MLNRTQWPLPLIAIAALVGGVGLSGGTLAVWNAAQPAQGMTVTSGDLEVASVDDPVWTETSADVADAPKPIDPDTFLVRRGDTMTATYDFSVALEGDNMRAEALVDWTRAPQLPAGVTGTYTVVGSDGTPHPIGTASQGETFDLTGTGAEDGTVTLAFTLDFSGLNDRFGVESAAQVTDLGDFTVDLQQVRTGGAFQ